MNLEPGNPYDQYDQNVINPQILYSQQSAALSGGDRPPPAVPSGYGRELVYLEWLDSSIPSNGNWHSLEEIETDDPCLNIISVGWVLVSADSFITIAAQMQKCNPTKDHYHVGGILTIPKVAITKMLVLSTPKDD